MKHINESIRKSKGPGSAGAGTLINLSNMASCVDSGVLVSRGTYYTVYEFMVDTDVLFGRKSYTNLWHALVDVLFLGGYGSLRYPTSALNDIDELYVLDKVYVTLNVTGKEDWSYTDDISNLDDRREVELAVKRLCRKISKLDLSNMKIINVRYKFSNDDQKILKTIDIDLPL